jgi:phosphatidylethanolamine-binding protein (PEBP) family uncharacterized protein
MRSQLLRFAAAATGGLFLVHCAAKDADPADQDALPAQSGGAGAGNLPSPTSPTNTATTPVSSSTPTAPLPTPSVTDTGAPATLDPPMPTAPATTATGTSSAPATQPMMSSTAPASGGSGGSGGEGSGPDATGTASGGGMNPPGAGGAGGDDQGMAGSPDSGGAGGMGPTAGGEFTLTSTNFEDGDELPDAFTCASMPSFGAGPMPQLAWSNPPEGTLSFALTFIDTFLTAENVNNSLAYHWAMWNISADTTMIAEGEVDMALLTELGAEQTGQGFLGPCPRLGGPDAVDTYAMTLYALDVAELPNPPSGVQEIEALLKEHALGTAALTCSSDANVGDAL